MPTLCSVIDYEPRVRAEDVYIYPARTYGAFAAHTLPALPPIDPCSFPFSDEDGSDRIYPSVQYDRSTITDYVLSESTKRDFREAGVSFPQFCFKPVIHVKDKLLYETQPVLGKYLSANLYETKLQVAASSNYPGHYVCKKWWVSQVFFTDSSTISKLRRVYEVYPQATIAHSPTDADIRRALIAIQPTFGREVDSLKLPNFLIELRELKQLSGFLVNKYKNLAQLAGSAFLSHEFGVEPILKDLDTMKVLSNSVLAFAKKWNEFADAGKIMAFHQTIYKFGDEIALSETYAPDTDFFINYSGRYFGDAYLHLYVRPRHFDLDLVPKVEKHLRGLDNIAATVWEAIPFSFVVDWFTNFGSLFDIDEEKWLMYDVVDLGYSWKNGVECRMTGVYDAYGWVQEHTSIVVTPVNFEKTTYRRERLAPALYEGLQLQSGGLELTLRGLTPGQSLLSAALVATRR